MVFRGTCKRCGKSTYIEYVSSKRLCTNCVIDFSELNAQWEFNRKLAERIAFTSLLSLRLMVRAGEVYLAHPAPEYLHDSNPLRAARMIDLYFYCGWTLGKVGARFGVTRERASQIIRRWVRRAVADGLIVDLMEVR